MASFPICPLIDQRCFLGITNDRTPGCIIVSLGKKIIIRFRLSDQKQLCSWTTKDKLTTPVYFDADRAEYFAVFNGELISRWSKDREFIYKKLCKYKLPWLIHSIFCITGMRPILLFQSGSLALLGNDNKKSISILKDNVFPDGEICKAEVYNLSNRHYLCLLMKKELKSSLHFVPITDSDEYSYSIIMERKESTASLSCYTIIEEKNQLITLWSDGCLYSFDLEESIRNLDDFPGRYFMAFNNINCSLPCTMLPLDNHIAVYGADANGEGAEVVWVETSFGVIQNSLHLKLYSKPPRMWKVSSSYLITPVGQNLMVIPYKLKNTPKLDSLIAARYLNESNSTVEQTWEKNKITHETLGCFNFKYGNQEKLSDSNSEIIPSPEGINKLLEQGKVEEAFNNLNRFSDVSDKCIIDAVVYCLNAKHKRTKESLLQILSLPLLGDNETLSYIRDKLSFESALALIDMISNQLKKDPENESLFKWLTLLLDSHYQHYLLSKDETVVSRIESLKDLMNDLISDMVNLQELYKLLTGTLKSKVSLKSSVHYTVDKFRLF